MTILLDNTNTVIREIDTSSTVLVESNNSIIVVKENPTIVTVESTNSVLLDSIATAVVTSGAQGVQGPPGESTNTVSYISAIPIGGNRVVATNNQGQLVYPDTLSDTNVILGISTHAANIGELVEVQMVGSMTEPSWNWIPQEPLFISANGLLIQTPPTTGLSQVIAYAVLSNKIFIDKQQPILLG